MTTPVLDGRECLVLEKASRLLGQIDSSWAGGPHLIAPPLKRVPHISLLRCGIAECPGGIGGWEGGLLFGERSTEILFPLYRVLL